MSGREPGPRRPALSRRSLLFASGAALAVPALAAGSAGAAAESPIRALWGRYCSALRAHHAALEGTPSGRWVRAAELSAPRRAMEAARAAMARMPATSIEDAGLKAFVLVGVGGEHHEFQAECLALLDAELGLGSSKSRHGESPSAGGPGA